MNSSSRKRVLQSSPVVFLMVLSVLATLGFGGRNPVAGAERPAPKGVVTMKTIGVLGGIGPQATMDFEARVHRVAQQRIAPNFNAGYPPMVVYFHRHAPIVVGEDGMSVPPLRIDPALRDAAARIGPMVDFVVITSNGVHAVADEIERAAGRPVLSMVDRVVEEVRRRGWKKVGLMTLGPPSLYAERLDRVGIGSERLDAARQADLNRAIFGVMEGTENDSTKQIARDALASIRARGVDGVIVGCTELPFLLGPIDGDPGLINPIQLLAEAAVERAMSPAARPTEVAGQR